MSWLLSIVAGLVTAVLGVEVVRFVFENWLQLYPNLSLTDACLILLIILQTATLVHLILWQRQAAADREAEQRTVRSPRTRQATTGARPPTARRRRPAETDGGESSSKGRRQ